MFTMQGSIWPTMLLHLLAITFSQFPNLTTSAKLTQLTLNLTHTLSPFAPLYDLNMSTFHNDTSSLEDIRFPLTRDPDLMLTVPVTLGTPPTKVVLLMDTGSSLTWAQCQPCKRCYKQKNPIYDSRASKTFRKLPCNDTTCRAAKYSCSKTDCIYDLVYGDGTQINGFASSETFYFSNGPSASPVPNIIFGCTNEIYKPGPLSRSGFISGIMGLNRSPQSLLTQLFPEKKRKFSYCFSPFTNGKVGTITNTVMRFGDDVPTKTPTLQIQFRNGFDNYHLDLLDISIGIRRLQLPAGTFTPTSRGNGGFVIDSGTLFPQIQKKGWGPWGGGKPYSTVMAAFKQYYSGLGLRTIKTPSGMKFELCYQMPSGFNKFASMTYHFQGADYVVDGKYNHVIEVRGGFFCVVVTAGSGVSVLGTFHQQNMRLVYDVSNGVLLFGAEDCTKDRP